MLVVPPCIPPLERVMEENGKDLFIVYLDECLPTYMSVQHMHAVPTVARGRYQILWDWTHACL